MPEPGERISAFQNTAPPAVGTLRSTYTDNNIFSAPAPGAISFHFRATGTPVSPTTGQRYRALITFGGRVTPQGEFLPDADVIHLTPVGG